MVIGVRLMDRVGLENHIKKLHDRIEAVDRGKSVGLGGDTMMNHTYYNANYMHFMRGQLAAYRTMLSDLDETEKL